MTGPIGADGDKVDVLIGPHRKAPHVYLIDQVDPDTKAYDEVKACLFFGSKNQALNCYRQAFSDGKGKDRIGHVTTMTVAEFKDYLKNYDTTKPLRSHT